MSHHTAGGTIIYKLPLSIANRYLQAVKCKLSTIFKPLD